MITLFIIKTTSTVLLEVVGLIDSPDNLEIFSVLLLGKEPFICNLLNLYSIAMSYHLSTYFQLYSHFLSFNTMIQISLIIL